MDSTWFLILAFTAIGVHALFIFLALFGPGLGYHLREPLDAPLDSQDFMCVLESLTDSKVHSCCSAEVLTNGEAYYEAELRDIREAKESIHLEAYIFERGRVTKQFVEALTERARAGVKVRLTIDAIGSWNTWDSYFKELRAAGGHVAWYHGFKWHLVPKLNNRTHRELLVIDSRIGYIGGSGFADHWRFAKKKHPRWRDTMLRVTGDAVLALQSTFADNWLESTGELLAGRTYFPELDSDDRSNILVVNSAPSAGGSTHARVLFQLLIAAAQKTVYINSPYFLPDKSAREELVAAAKRGVDVRIITPGHKSDHVLTRRASRRLLGDLLKNGVRVYEYQPAMIHHKGLIVDGRWSVVGSTNFDHRSFRLNDEVNFAARDARLAERLTEDFRQDLAESKEITYEKWKKRSIFERAHEFFGWILEQQQ